MNTQQSYRPIRTLQSMEFMGLLALLFVFFNVTWITTKWIFGGTIQPLDLPFSFLLALTADYFFLGGSREPRIFWRAVLIFLLLFAVGLAVSGLCFDTDWDGNALQKVGVGLMARGWNPVSESADTFGAAYFRGQAIASQGLWVDHYGKGLLIFAASVYRFFGYVECGKVIHFIGMGTVFTLLWPLLRRKGFRPLSATVLSVLLALNPVSLVQCLSYYNDGLVFSYFFVLVIGLTQLLEAAGPLEQRRVWATVLPAMVLLANMKFTGLLYGGVFCIAYYLFSCCLEKRRNPQGWKPVACKRCGLFALTAVISVCWVGFPTYVRNFLDHGTWTYPLTGPDAVDIMTQNSPIGFAGKGIFHNLFYGLFGQMENLYYSSERALPLLKWPFAVYPRELAILGVSVDTRVSGFGIWFSGILLLSAVLWLWYLIRGRRKDSGFTQTYWIMNLVLGIGFTLAISESWWARYSPFFYWMVFLGVVLLMRPGSEEPSPLYRSAADRARKLPALLLCLLFLINNLAFTAVPGYYLYHSPSYIRELSSLSGHSITIEPPVFGGKIFDLEDFGVDWTITDNAIEPAGSVYGLPYRLDK